MSLQILIRGTECYAYVFKNSDLAIFYLKIKALKLGYTLFGENLAQLAQNDKNRQIKSAPNLIFFVLRQI